MRFSHYNKTWDLIITTLGHYREIWDLIITTLSHYNEIWEAICIISFYNEIPDLVIMTYYDVIMRSGIPL